MSAWFGRKFGPVKKAIRRSTIACLILALHVNCAGRKPAWRGKVWAGFPHAGGIVRMQEGLHLSCADPEFSEFAALRYEDLNDLLALLYCDTECDW